MAEKKTTKKERTQKDCALEEAAKGALIGPEGAAIGALIGAIRGATSCKDSENDKVITCKDN